MAYTERETSEISREEGGEARSWWRMVLRSPEDKDTELGTLTALRVWKDRMGMLYGSRVWRLMNKVTSKDHGLQLVPLELI